MFPTLTERLLCRVFHQHQLSPAGDGYRFIRCTTPGCGISRLLKPPRIRRGLRAANRLFNPRSKR